MDVSDEVSFQTIKKPLEMSGRCPQKREKYEPPNQLGKNRVTPENRVNGRNIRTRSPWGGTVREREGDPWGEKPQNTPKNPPNPNQKGQSPGVYPKNGKDPPKSLPFKQKISRETWGTRTEPPSMAYRDKGGN
ncbi:hypothetical protein JTB14_026539 [Gonioctena quinquepunctata]|nr:hypothetical protein JTB14_026539 [Gonioctena quinquepunctata]